MTTLGTRLSRTQLDVARAQSREIETVRRPGLAGDIDGAGTTDLFTITDGPVLLYRLFGVITTVLGIGAGTFRFVFTPTGGGALTNMNAVSGALNGTAQNVCLQWAGTLAAAMVVGVGVGHLDLTGTEAGFASPITVTSGVIGLLVATGVTTGVVDWYISYLPLNADGLIVAA